MTPSAATSPTRLSVRGDDIMWEEIDGDIVLLDLRSSTYLSLNRSASLLWKALVGGSTHGALTSLLSASYDLDLEGAAADVLDFLTTLEVRGLLERG